MVSKGQHPADGRGDGAEAKRFCPHVPLTLQRALASSPCSGVEVRRYSGRTCVKQLRSALPWVALPWETWVPGTQRALKHWATSLSLDGSQKELVAQSSQNHITIFMAVTKTVTVFPHHLQSSIPSRTVILWQAPTGFSEGSPKPQRVFPQTTEGVTPKSAKTEATELKIVMTAPRAVWGRIAVP